MRPITGNHVWCTQPYALLLADLLQPYIPFCSEIPRSTQIGWITAEIARYIKRCSAEVDYWNMLTLLWSRLRVRGCPAAFLRETFARAPHYRQRDELLFRRRRLATEKKRLQVMITDYSHAKRSMRIEQVMHDNAYLLPPQLRSKFVLAYRSAPKLSSQLVTYRFPRTERAPDTSPPPPQT
eukprot:SAG25_NODE_101_length_15508_cov_11.653384_2_plen_181_part_00